MAVRTFDVVLATGERHTVRMTPKLFLMCERKWGKADNMPDMEAMLYSAWIALVPGIPFDDWVDTIEEIIPPEELDDANPPSPALSAD
jgi:hypothetical protein